MLALLPRGNMAADDDAAAAAAAVADGRLLVVPPLTKSASSASLDDTENESDFDDIGAVDIADDDANDDNVDIEVVVAFVNVAAC